MVNKTVNITEDNSTIIEEIYLVKINETTFINPKIMMTTPTFERNITDLVSDKIALNIPIQIEYCEEDMNNS